MSQHALPAHEIAAKVKAGEITAVAVAQAALADIGSQNPALNCFTTILADRALKDARAVDAKVKAGQDPGPLAGVPFGVKDLYDVEDVVTLAGSKILADNPPQPADGLPVARLKAAGAVLLGCCNMDEFAYGFSTENMHYGATRNPRDPARITGGSSGGSAAAVGAGMVALSMGSDTNGSIRVPASFCGIFGLKPTYGRLPRTGSFPFVPDLDHIGPFARSTADLALAYDVLQGFDASDAACVDRPVEPASAGLRNGIAGLKAGVLDGWFESGASDDALDAVARVAQALGPTRKVTLEHADVARSAAFCITCSTGSALHLERLKARPQDFDFATRDRFYAGALLPAMVLVRAQRFRRRFLEQALKLFGEVDVLLAPATPNVAPFIGQKMMMLNGVEVSARANIGLYTQPISFIGLPVVTVPLWTKDGLPIGVQIIAPPWAEAMALQVAAFLEQQGIVSAKGPGA
ncbi:MAG TPA: AtzE family amidohydrolase [Stellaceae bacterium]|nr:AtzE family amidohydrolase [Stellaceae bacterium]